MPNDKVNNPNETVQHLIKNFGLVYRSILIPPYTGYDEAVTRLGTIISSISEILSKSHPESVGLLNQYVATIPLSPSKEPSNSAKIIKIRTILLALSKGNDDQQVLDILESEEEKRGKYLNTQETHKNMADKNQSQTDSTKTDYPDVKFFKDGRPPMTPARSSKSQPNERPEKRNDHPRGK